MIRRWLVVHHPDLWATRVPGMVASGGLLTLLAAAYGYLMPVDIRDLQPPGPLFGWTAALSALLTLYWAFAALMQGDGGRVRGGASGWTGLWATALGLVLLNAAPFVAPEAYEARLRALVPRERLEGAARAFSAVASTRALLAARVLQAGRGQDLEERLAGVLRSKEDPDLPGARRLLQEWDRVPADQRTLSRALEVAAEAMGVAPAVPEFERVLEEFGPGLEGEFAPDRRLSNYSSMTDLLAEENLLWLVSAYDEGGEPSHMGEDPQVRVVYFTLLLWLTLLVAVGRPFGAVLAGVVSGVLGLLWIVLKLLVPIALADAAETAEAWWRAALWVALWIGLAVLWAPAAARRRRTPRALALFTAWVLLLPFVGSWLLAVFETPEELHAPLVAAGLLLPLALAPLLQLVVNRFAAAPEGEPSTRAPLALPDPGAVLRPVHRWVATHAPAVREDRLPAILGSSAALGALVSAYAASLPVSLAAPPPSYEATTALPWMVGLLLTVLWAGLLSLDAPALPVRRGSRGWPRLPLLALAFASLTLSPFVASEIVDMRLRPLVSAEQVRTDLDHLKTLGNAGRAQALELLMRWREEPAASPSRVKELSRALDYQVEEEHRVRAAAILREWAALPEAGRDWIAGAEVLGRHGAWAASDIPWQEVLARYGGSAEAVVETTAGTQQKWFNSNDAIRSAQRIASAHGVATAGRPPWRDRDLLSSWLWVTLLALFWVAGVRAVGVRWMVVGGGLLLGALFALAFLAELVEVELGDLNAEDLAIMVLLGASAVALALSVSLRFRRVRTRGLCLLLAVGLLGLPFLPLLVGMTYGIEDGGAVPFWFSLAGSAVVLAASPAWQALLNLYRASPGDGVA